MLVLHWRAYHYWPALPVDFDIDNAKLSIQARTIRNAAGRVALYFSHAFLDAEIRGSGACSLFGLDL